MTNEEIAYFEVLHDFISTMTEIENVSIKKGLNVSKVKKMLLEISDAYILLLEG